MSDNFKNNNKNNEQSKFGLPDGYFQKSAQTIFNKIEWQEEHKAFANLLANKKKSGFVVPENYFTKTEASLELLEFEKLNSCAKRNAFVVPNGYFEQASTTLSLTINERDSLNGNELLEFPTLVSLKKQNSFTVPANYFSENAQKLKEVASTGSATNKVINLFSPKMWYSVAALLVIALGLWMYNSYYKLAPVNDCGTLACVDKIDLVKAKHLDNIETEDLYKLVNTKKLEENLASAGSDTEKTKTNKEKNDTSLKSVSDDDLLDEL